MVWGLSTSAGFQPALPTASRMRTKPSSRVSSRRKWVCPSKMNCPARAVRALVGQLRRGRLGAAHLEQRAVHVVHRQIGGRHARGGAEELPPRDALACAPARRPAASAAPRPRAAWASAGSARTRRWRRSAWESGCRLQPARRERGGHALHRSAGSRAVSGWALRSCERAVAPKFTAPDHGEQLEGPSAEAQRPRRTTKATRKIAQRRNSKRCNASQHCARRPSRLPVPSFAVLCGPLRFAFAVNAALSGCPSPRQQPASAAPSASAA